MKLAVSIWYHASLRHDSAHDRSADRSALAINGQWISAPEDDRFELVIRVATNALLDPDKIAEHLRAWSYRED